MGVPAAIAGASRGLGYAVALELAREGARVAICSRDSGAVESAAMSIREDTGAAVVAVTADVSTTAGSRRFIDEAAAGLDGLQVLVSNAGGPPAGDPESFDERQWLEALQLNFLSHVRMTTASLEHMEAQEWGRIVLITSNVVKQPDPRLSLSAAARSAATAYAKTLADTVASRGITVNCVMPGQILTDRLRGLSGAAEGAGADDPAFEAMASRIPIGRLGEPAEFAAAVAFLCSRRASFINGISLAVDGGFLRGIV